MSSLLSQEGKKTFIKGKLLLCNDLNKVLQNEDCRRKDTRNFLEDNTRTGDGLEQAVDLRVLWQTGSRACHVSPVDKEGPFLTVSPRFLPASHSHVRKTCALQAQRMWTWASIILANAGCCPEGRHRLISGTGESCLELSEMDKFMDI